jgi:hypothetical protein
MLPLTNCTSNASGSEKQVCEATVTFKHHRAAAMICGAIFMLTFFDSPFIYGEADVELCFGNDKYPLKTTSMF